MDYRGIKCPVCGKPFAENDDVVVCPVCGAPYHRSCYAEKGACIFTDLHESRKAWAPPPPPVAPDAATEIKDKECPNCGVLNGHSALFCSACGASLTGMPGSHANRAPSPMPAQEQRTVPPPAGYGVFPGTVGGVPFAMDPMGGANPTEPLADNVTYGDVSKVVQQNTGYYLAVFRRMRSFGHGKFSFCGFLFSGGWLLYRKQYKAGIIVTALMFLLFIANTAISYFALMPMILEAVDSAGISLSELTYIQLSDALMLYLESHPQTYFLFLLPLLFLVLTFGIMLFVGIRGNRMYLNHCVRTVQKIKSESSSAQDLDTAYSERGGVSLAAALCVFGCYVVIRMIPQFFL